MPAVRVVDEHLLSPVLVYSGSGGVFSNEKILKAGTGLSVRNSNYDLVFDVNIEGTSGVLVTTGSNGEIKVSADLEKITADISKKYINEIVFNENVASNPDQIGNFFSLASTPSDVTTVQLWLNGQLLTPGFDFSVVDRTIQILSAPIEPNDKLVASYSRHIALKQYKFGERLFPVNNQVILNNIPVTNNDVMVFLNGQLQLRGIYLGDNDYHIEGRQITFNFDVKDDDIILASYSYS